MMRVWFSYDDGMVLMRVWSSYGSHNDDSTSDNKTHFLKSIQTRGHGACELSHVITRGIHLLRGT